MIKGLFSFIPQISFITVQTIDIVQECDANAAD